MSVVLEEEVRAADRKCVGPLLESGLHLSQPEFHARYDLMPQVKKAELVKGIVYMGSPISKWHGDSTAQAAACFSIYAASLPGVEVSSAGSTILDVANEFQPDVFMRLNENWGGQSRVSGQYLAGAPELVMEIALSSAAYDLHEKLEVYQEHRVREYIVWQGEKDQMSCFRLEGARFLEVALGADGIFRSTVFPGLWLDVGALLRGDMPTALQTVQNGLKTAEAKKFRVDLESRRANQ